MTMTSFCGGKNSLEVSCWKYLRINYGSGNSLPEFLEDSILFTQRIGWFPLDILMHFTILHVLSFTHFFYLAMWNFCFSNSCNQFFLRDLELNSHTLGFEFQPWQFHLKEENHSSQLVLKTFLPFAPFASELRVSHCRAIFWGVSEPSTLGQFGKHRRQKVFSNNTCKVWEANYSKRN